MKKVKEWKKNSSHQFEFGPLQSLKRLKDGEFFLLFHNYRSYGKINGTMIQLSVLSVGTPDMVHVDYEIFGLDDVVMAYGTMQINDIYKYVSENGDVYLKIPTDSTVTDTRTSLCYSD